uniref:Uncharacterized protein n=1 Tax=Geobacter metallireducens TaxID=28232 RepID=A0A831U1G4_GEOME
MITVQRGILVGITFLLLTVWCTPCKAQDTFEGIFRNALYGGLAGGLVGAALLVFTDKPGDHLDYIGYGAASGVLAGTAYGVAKTTRALAELENGKVKLAVPTIVPESVRTGADGEREVVLMAEVLRGRF